MGNLKRNYFTLKKRIQNLRGREKSVYNRGSFFSPIFLYICSLRENYLNWSCSILFLNKDIVTFHLSKYSTIPCYKLD